MPITNPCLTACGRTGEFGHKQARNKTVPHSEGLRALENEVATGSNCAAAGQLPVKLVRGKAALENVTLPTQCEAMCCRVEFVRVMPKHAWNVHMIWPGATQTPCPF